MRMDRTKARILTLGDESPKIEDIVYWLSRPSHERFEAVDILRGKHGNNRIRLRRVYRIIERQQR